MDIVIVTGSCGLIGSEACRYYANKGYTIVGIDNNMRAYFFGEEASTEKQHVKLDTELLDRYIHYQCDIRDIGQIENIFSTYSSDIKLVIHTAAQPSHDWAAKEPQTDFTINANGTLNLLEATRKYCSDAVFIFTSTNKVYGDTPNFVPLIEMDKRWEIDPKVSMMSSLHISYGTSMAGVNENMTIDKSTHSIFGVGKVASDLMVQEYGKYFGLKTGVFRGGCLTGPAHSGAELHGFLSYLVLCAVNNKPYTIFGYKGKQVRDNIHSYDLINAFNFFYENPRCGEVYNMGGSRHSNISILEAIDMIEEISGYKLNYTISDKNRIGDHIWYISDVYKFRSHYPGWEYKYDIKMILSDMIESAKR